MKVLIFQHVECEHPGQLRMSLQEDGADWCTVELDADEPIPTLDAFDALWVMGGPMDVWEVDKYPWLVAEKDAIRKWVSDLKRPFLGICLGHQLLADALGGRCEAQLLPEIGVCDVTLTRDGREDPLFFGMPARQKVLQWHSVGVVKAPVGATVLASSDSCPVQAMRVGQCAWSIQYHVEAELDTVEHWGTLPEYRQALEKVAGFGALEQLSSDLLTILPSLRTTSDTLYRNFRNEVFKVRGV